MLDDPAVVAVLNLTAVGQQSALRQDRTPRPVQQGDALANFSTIGGVVIREDREVVRDRDQRVGPDDAAFSEVGFDPFIGPLLTRGLDAATAAACRLDCAISVLRRLPV